MATKLAKKTMRTFLHPSSMTNLKSLKRTRKTKNLSSHSTAVSSLSKLLNQMDRGMIVSMRSCQTAQAWADTDLLMVGLAVPTWQGITNPVPHCLLSSFTPSHQLQGKKHQAVQDLPPANTFVGAGDNISIGSDHCSEYSCQTSNKYSKQMRVHPYITVFG